MTRVIAGRLKGRRLATPPGEDTRPTTDRVREALFSSLHSELGELAGLRVLDLFAGSGALGIEALSRGAARADFVESGRRAAPVIRRNLADLDLRGRVHLRTALSFARRTDDVFDLVLCDPPYDMPGADVTRLLALLLERSALAPGALVVVERSARAGVDWPAEIEPLRERRYGETTLWYGRVHG